MRQNPVYALDDRAEIAQLIRDHPWATLVSDGPQGLVASHYPVLLDEERDDLTVLTHVGKPDDEVHGLGERELLVIVQGPHGYVSPSWYPGAGVPTWDFVVAHLSGVPEVLSEEENLRVLARLVDHFEDAVPEPRRLLAPGDQEAYARRIAPYAVGLRLTPSRVEAKRKMSQNQAPETVARIVAELEGDGPYASPELARAVRAANAGR
jgi:transcriptional regulator